MNDIEPDFQNETNLPSWARDLEAMRKQRQGGGEAVDEDRPFKPSAEEPLAEPEPTEEESRQAYQHYLHSWQQQHNLAPEAEAADRTHILFGDEWQRECSEILSHEAAHEENTVLLKLNLGEDVTQSLTSEPPAESDEDLFAEASSAHTDTVSCTVKVMAPPAGTEVRVALMDETLLKQQLQEKLRDHLNDAIAGVVKTAIQRHLYALVQTLQRELPQELASVTDEVMHLHLQQALDEIKAAAGVVKKMS